MDSKELHFSRQQPLKVGGLAMSDSMGRVILIAALIVLALVPINLLQQKFLGWSVLVSLKDWLLHFNLEYWDSWKPMRNALDYAAAGHPDSLYQEIFFNQHVKFQYPPTALLPMLGLQSLGIDTNVFLNNINRFMIAINAIGVGWLFRLLLIRTNGVEAAASPAGIAGAVLAGAATLLFYPLMMAFWLGQIQIWIDTGFTFACIAVLTDRKLTAGVLVGLLCLLKPQFSLFALWALLRRQWRFMLGAAIAIVPAGLVSIAVFGLAAHLDYLRVLSFLSQHGEAMIANNSVNGVLNALLGTADPLVWDEHGFPAYNPIVCFGSMAAVILLIGAALWPQREQSAFNGLLDFEIAALAFTMAAPIAWEHHYGIMPPIFATLFCLLAASPESVQRRQRLVAFAVLFLLSTLCVASARYAVATPLNLAHGYLFFAGLGVIAMLWRASGSLNPQP
jgi:alpha-1,2-mannosyltransferase